MNLGVPVQGQKFFSVVKIIVRQWAAVFRQPKEMTLRIETGFPFTVDKRAQTST